MTARLEAMRYVLSSFDYQGKDKAATTLTPDPECSHALLQVCISNRLIWIEN